MDGWGSLLALQPAKNHRHFEDDLIPCFAGKSWHLFYFWYVLPIVDDIQACSILMELIGRL